MPANETVVKQRLGQMRQRTDAELAEVVERRVECDTEHAARLAQLDERQAHLEQQLADLDRAIAALP